MTTQEQIIAIAELDGWHNIQPNPLYPNRYAGFTKGDTHALCGIPDYLTSRDAIVPVIEKQSYVMRTQMIDFLCELMIENYDGSDYIKQSDIPLLMSATPSQLCEALLRAAGKWKD